MGTRQWLYRQLVPEARPAGISPLNAVIVALVFLSLLMLALETEPVLQAVPAWQVAFSIFNVFVLTAFATEYVLRVWVAGDDPRYGGAGGRLKYMTRPYAVADLIAFLPELIILLIGSGVPLFFLRVLRLARLIKIVRFIPAFEALGQALRRSAVQLVTSLALALTLVYVAAVLLYFVEGVGGAQQEDFASIPRAVWWAVATLPTVGYGDVYPVTPFGRVCAGVIAVAGIGVVALPAGIFASAFSDEMRERDAAKRKPSETEPERARSAPTEEPGP